MDAPVVIAGDRTMAPDTDESVRCTVSGCSCLCFTPGRAQLRSCDRCGHGWVTHACEKLQAHPLSCCGPVEVALPGLVFDLSSLVLYGAQAVPVRLKILLDRLYSILAPEQVSHILRTLGWSLGDYVRGYMLQYPSGKVLDRWLMVTPEEELFILKQFLRFGETRPIVELMMLQCLAAASHLSDPQQTPIPKSCQSKTSSVTGRDGAPGVFRNAGGDSGLVAGVYRFEKNRTANHDDTVQHFESFVGGLSLLLPFHFQSSAHHCLGPSTKEFLPLTKLTRCLRKPSETKLAERQRHDAGKVEQENEQQFKGELALKIKADPDKPNKVQSLWPQIPRFNQESDLHKHVAKQENTSSLSNSSFVPPSDHSPISSSSSPPTKISQKLLGSSASSLNPLPSFSSSFLCPFPASSFSSSHHPLQPSSSSLHPLPSSLCSLPTPSPAGGRKGRVCCGVCGKSFYDKGTLKIHYNAVHLKIKHRCTVAGCTMVFSSLRSRNRHSANPNPRLHTGASRDAHIQRKTHSGPHSETQIDEVRQAHKNIPDSHMCRGKDMSHTQWLQVDNGHTIANAHILRKRLNGTNAQHGRDTAPQTDSPSPPSLPWTLSQDTTRNFTMNDSRSNLHHQAPPPPFLPAHNASSLGPPPSLVSLDVPAMEKQSHHQLSLHTGHTGPLPGTITLANSNDEPASQGYGVSEESQGAACTNEQQRRESGDPMPKKKPRKSSMPVKIERETWEGKRYKEEESC